MSNYNGQFQDSSANILLATPHSYANIEGSTASQAYVKGQMLVYNNRLCEVIAPISSGNTLTIGTNIAYKNVGDIGKQLVASDGKGFYFDVKDGAYGFYPSASKVASEFVPFGGSTVYWSNPVTGTYLFPAQTITLTKPCKKICVIWGGNNTSINVDAETITNQLSGGGNLVWGVLVLERGQTKKADMTSDSRGTRTYTFSADGASVVVGASTYQQGYQTPALIFSLE